MIEKYRDNDIQWEFKKDKDRFLSHIYYDICLYVFNSVILSNIFTYFLSKYVTLYDLNYRQSFFSTVLHLAFMSFTEDFCFYFSHRIMHTSFFYRHFHKIHHSKVNTMHIHAIYFHPVEQLFNFVSLFSGFLILGTKNCHLVTLFIFMILRLQEAHEVHSGYHLPISILKANPLHVETNFHNYHHVRNSGNFGSFFAIQRRTQKTSLKMN